MSVTFCSSCGAKHEYNYAKPKFCSSCGNSFSIQSTGPSVSRAKNSVVNDEDDYDDDNEDDASNSDSSRVPNIRRLDFELEVDTDIKTFSLGSIFGESNSQQSRSRRQSSTSVDDFVNNKPRRGN